MPKKSPPIIINQVLRDISNIQDLIDEAHSLKKSVKKVDVDDKLELNEFVEGTKSIITRIQDEVSRINLYFGKFYDNWETSNNIVNENSVMNNLDQELHKEIINCEEPSLSKVGCQDVCIQDASSISNVEDINVCIQNDKSHTNVDVLVSVDVNIDNETSDNREISINETDENDANTKQHEINSQQIESENKESEESNSILNNDIVEEAQNENQRNEENDQTSNRTDDTSPKDVVSNDELKDTIDNSDEQIANNAMDTEILDAETITAGGEFQENLSGNVNEIINSLDGIITQDIINNDKLKENDVTDCTNKDTDATIAISKDNETGIPTLDTDDTTKDFDKSILEDNIEKNNKNQLINDEGDINDNLDEEDHTHKKNDSVINGIPLENTISDVENSKEISGDDEKVDSSKTDSDIVINEKTSKKHKKINGKRRSKNNVTSSDDDDKSKKNKKLNLNDDEEIEKTKNNSVNNEIESDENTDSKVKEIKEENVWKIKCVDINKLIDPTIINEDSSIVVISDSDAEMAMVKKTKQSKKNPTNVSRPARPTRSTRQAKKVILLEDSDSTDCDIEKKIQSISSEYVGILRKTKNGSERNSSYKSKRSVRFTESYFKSSSEEEKASPRSTSRRDRNKKTRDLVEVSSLSDSSSSTDNDNDGAKAKKRNHEKKKNRNEASLELSLINAQEDKKFSWKTEVPLPIIPAQKLKENYEKKILKSQIKRLTNMDTLKRSRSKTSELQSSSDSTTEAATKRTKNENPPKKDTKENESKNSDSEMKNSDSEAKNSTSEPEASISANNDVQNEKNDEVTKAILSGMKSGSDSSTNTSDDDQPSDKKADADKEKKNKENSKKEISDKDNDQDKDSNSESDKEKKKWRKDKLLTEKISESDSDENFEKFTKKKNKLEEMTSDTEDITPKKIIKRNKRRRIKIVGSDSDDSSYGKKSNSSSEKDSSSSDSDEENEEDDDKTKKPARRRVKRLKDSSDDDDDKSTRKNIRKVWKKDSLAETTIQAEKEEQERKARIAEKQKKYNQIFEPDCLEKATVDRVVLDFNEETKEELLKVDDEIVKHLKPHQVKGIQFMWDACFESIERTKSTTGSGCILAHCMGLGKTLQVITLSHTLLMNEETGISKVLVVAPLSTVLNWVAEFKKWLPNDDVVEVFELVSYKQNYERQYQVQEWSRCGGVLIMGYDMFRNLTNPNNKRMSKKMRTTFHSSLVDPGPDLVICDEGHLLKNEKSSISVAMNRLRTMRRIVLTGTPLQNNLKEYFCMVQFVKPSLLGTYKEYLNRFVNPITNGQYTDSTPHDIQIMRKRSHVLHKLLDGVVQRKDYSVLAPYLPPKYEYVLFVSLTEIQIKLYEFYLKEKAKQPQMNKRSSFLFIDFQELQRICTHPRVLLNRSIKAKLERDKRDYDEESEGSLKDFIDDGDEKTTSDSSSGSSKSGSDSDENAESNKTKPRRVTRATASTIVLSEEEEPEAEPHESEWFSTFCKEEDFDNITHSGKLSLLFEILRQAESIGDKVLVFSQSLYSLSIIEYFLSKIDEATQNGDVDGFCGFSGSWSLGLDYFRLDGSSSCDNRAAWCKSFNNPDNIRARLFLISTRAGGLGINLVAANRVIIFDVSWNPSHDTQSIYRVYRFGQNKPSFIYRFVTMGTMEMKVYERQVIKQSISKRVIDEQQIDRHYNQNDLAELYKFDPHPEERPIPLVPKDVLLGELLQQDAKIYKYHEHQSLLENKVDEVLDEAERKAAWEEFENEKKARQYSGTINNTSTQLIVKALASIVQKDNPEWDPATVQNMVPALLTQLEEQIALGDMSMYTRVMAEIRLMQTAEQQKFQEYYRLQQQAFLMRQYQQQLLNNPNASQFFQQWNQYRQPLRGNMGRVHNPGPSANSTRNLIPNNPNEVIDLND